MAKTRGRPRHDDVLTPAEWRVADAVRHGLGNREIARRLGVSVDAVKFHVANAVGKLGLGDRRALRHWRGAPKGSAAHAGEDTMSTEFSIHGLGQVARTVSDVERSSEWYRDVLGLAHLYTFGSLAFFDCGGTRLMLSADGELNAAESILYFRVPDIESAAERLRSRGVTFRGAPHMIHRHADGSEEWMAFFDDPDGRPLALMTRTAAPSD